MEANTISTEAKEIAELALSELRDRLPTKHKYPPRFYSELIQQITSHLGKKPLINAPKVVNTTCDMILGIIYSRVCETDMPEFIKEFAKSGAEIAQREYNDFVVHSG